MFSGNTSQVSADQLYVEDVFSTWLYTGNGSTQTITNGIDLAGKGGLVWTKVRNSNFNHILADTTRGGSNVLYSDSSVGNQAYPSTIYTAFGSTGYTLGNANEVNGAFNYASWTFREAPKFFDVVTYTGTGANRTIAHNLGVAPGCILIKRTNTSGDWQVYHRSNANTEYMVLNTTAAKATGTTRWNSTTPTSTEFTVGTDTTVNASGGTYVAYLFAHDATSDGVIQCGSLTFPTGGSQVEVNLGWEPQWLLVKSADTTDNWYVFDNMRGMGASNVFKDLRANTTAAEADLGNATYPDNITSTGFSLNGGFFGVGTNTKFIYIAIRRGPMKTPTLGTSVFSPIARTGTSANTTVAGPTSGASDLVMVRPRLNASATSFAFADRLRSNLYMTSDTNFNQTSNSASFQSNPWDVMSGVKLGSGGASSSLVQTNGSSYNYINYLLRRAPGFFDETCYTGTGVASTVSHNLGVAPELVIVKSRSLYADWQVYSASLANTEYLVLNSTAAKATGTTRWNSTTPTATDFTVGTDITVNSSGATYVAYLFASCPGVSKVGSYTGTGTTQTIDCGFAAGARFVLIKRTNSTGDWYVWDTARGIVSGNDPHLSLNAQAGEVTTDDTIDTDSSGFVVNQVAATNVNVSSATYIYLAIA